MKYMAISITLLFCLGLVQSQTADALNLQEFSDDVNYLTSTFGSSDSDDCYTLMLGNIKQGKSGFVEVDVNELRAALEKGPSIEAKGSCAAFSTMESVKMIISYNNAPDVEFPVSRLSEMKTTQGFSERLMHEAKEVRFSEIRFKDSDGVEHTLADQTFHIVS